MIPTLKSLSLRLFPSIPSLPSRQQRLTCPRTMAVRCLLAAVAMLLILACGQPVEQATTDAATPTGPTWSTASMQAADAIDGERMAEWIRHLASDELEGRGPGSQGDAAARSYIAEQLKALGIQPGMPGDSFEQTFPIVGINSQAPPVWSFSTADGKSSELAWWDEYIATSGIQEPRAAIDQAELVFVGYGIEAPEHDWNDFKDVDLQGKVLVMLNNDPDWDDNLFAGQRRLYYGRWDYKYESAARQGAAAAIIVHTTESAGYPWQVVQTSWTGEQFELPAGDEPRLAIEGWMTHAAGERLLAEAGQQLAGLIEAAKERDFAPVPLGLTTSLTLQNTIRSDVETANVLGLLPGSDPTLGDEVVVYTAHHDHLGRGEPDAEGDDIYNGARDNASGVAQILGIASAFAALPEPPRRSILFLLVAAEEQGLLGSQHYAQHPTFAPGKIAANINFDSGNIFGRTRDLVYIGYGKSSLDRVAEAVAAKQDRLVVGDLFPDRGFFYRSDQFNFAKIGVPAMYLDGGTDFRDDPDGAIKEHAAAWEKTSYHQPSDEIDDSWVMDGMVEDARAGFLAGIAIAQDDTAPSWNAGDEFEAARLAALDEVESSR